MTLLESKFNTTIDEAVNGAWSDQSFQWGQRDCLLSLGDIVDAVTGHDPCEAFRNRYTTFRGAMRVTKEYGGFEGALRWVASCCGWVQVPVAEAPIGAIGLLKVPEGTKMFGALIRHRQLWVGRTEGRGFVALPDDNIKLAWRIA